MDTLNTSTPKLSYMKKAALEKVYGLKVYTSWKQVPKRLITKTEAIALDIDIKDKRPVAIKSSRGTKSAYYLYDCGISKPEPQPIDKGRSQMDFYTNHFMLPGVAE